MEYQNSDDFYNSDVAEQMAKEYKKSLLATEELFKTADILEKQARSMRSLLLHRRRVRLEIRLQRVLLNILLSLTPADQELGKQTYDRLLNCVARLEKLC